MPPLTQPPGVPPDVQPGVPPYAYPQPPQAGAPGLHYYHPPPYAAHQDIGQDATMRMLLPVGRSGWAIAAGYLGLISVSLVPAPLALVLGVVAVRDIRRNPHQHGMGRAVFGIVMGALGTLGLLMMLYARATAASRGGW